MISPKIFIIVHGPCLKSLVHEVKQLKNYTRSNFDYDMYVKMYRKIIHQIIYGRKGELSLFI